MGNSISTDRGYNASNDIGRSNDHSARLRPQRGLLGLPRPRGAPARLRAVPSRANANTSSCHAILIELLTNFEVVNASDHCAALLAEFGSMSSLLAASSEAQARVTHGEPAVTRCLSLMRRTMLHVLKSEVTGRSVFSSGDALIGYLKISLAGATEEHLRVLFLNARNEMLKDEQCFPGSATAVLIRPRPIIKRALELGATAVILVHNHPSGDPNPSDEDIRATAALIEAAAPLEIMVHDHIIIGHRTWTSLKSNGLIRQAA